MDRDIMEVVRALANAGARALLVGGYVRDGLLGIDSKDYDLEIYGLALENIEGVLAGFGEVIHVGRAFGVLRVKGIDADFSLPRRDSKVATGHRGFRVEFDPGLDFQEASRRRDLTINSIGLDPLTEEILDPHGGRRDLERRVLRATDPSHFAEDALRGLRAAQLAARFEMTADDELVALCAQLDLSELAPERIFEEFRKLLLRGSKPSMGLALMHQANMLRFFPELAALVDVPQDPHWHPEGDVWTHTLMVMDEAAGLRNGGDDDLALMYAALCHDFGKPDTTTEDRGRIRSLEHDVSGARIARTFLKRLRAPERLVSQVDALVRHHLAPALYVGQRTTAKGYRRLARKLDAAHVSMELLVRVARADHWGRTTEEARRRVFPAADAFLEAAKEASVMDHAPTDVVQGRHLMARGLRPGPHFGDILARCREVQDETGWTDAQMILDRVMEDQ
jgi:tRNA nucleotidyltransferase (CCA-adding enzyme)